jgi:hypothetical protein
VAAIGNSGRHRKQRPREETAASRGNSGSSLSKHSFLASLVREPAVNGAHGRGGRGRCGGEEEHYSFLNVIVGVQAANDTTTRIFENPNRIKDSFLIFISSVKQ